MKTAFLFPGQGAQTVGMGKDVCDHYPEAAEIFAKANDIVGFDLAKLCFEGPQEELNTTTISQPAIYTTSAAMLEVVRKRTELQADVVAGLSLGEYSALYAAGVVSFEDGLKLVQKRGTAMQAAADSTDGSMVSIMGLDETKVAELCDEAAQGDVLAGVNYNCPGQIVISGSKAACERAVGLAEKYGAMKAIELAVAGAFHSELMNSAADELAEALEKTEIADPKQMKIISNINAEYYSSAAEIKEGLKKQLTSVILWQKCMERLLAESVENYYEIGPGRVLTGLMRRIDRKTKVNNISSAENLENLISSEEKK